jgi:hypothetical protein
MTISRAKFVLFALLTVTLVVTAGCAVLLGADLLLHQRAQRSAGVNRWGYRGPVAARKQANEVRVVMLGGSTVFGYGVLWSESIPAFLERRLNQHHPEHPWRVINLGYNTEGAFAFLPNLQDFAFLDYDIVVLYEGYNDLVGDLSPNQVTVRRQSPIFRATGYLPILPLWLSERSLLLRSGDLDSGYQSRRDAAKTVFRPTLAARASASALDAAASVTRSLERQFDVAASRERSAIPAPSTSAECPAPWSGYCESERRAIQYALDRGKRVLVVSQPSFPTATSNDRHQQQQQALTAMLARVFGGTPRVAHFAIGRLVKLEDLDVSFDQMHLSVDGNRIVADALREPLVQLSMSR